MRTLLPVGRVCSAWAPVALLFLVSATPCHPQTGATDRGDQPSRSYEGILKTGIVAIGGETTGVNLVTQHDGVFELDFGQNEQLRKSSEALNGKKVIVVGDYKPRPGLEVKERRVILVKTLRAAN